MSKRVYRAEDVEVSVAGRSLEVFDRFVDINVRLPEQPRKNTRVRVCSLGDGEAARIAEMLSRRLRLGEAWPFGLLDVSLSDDQTGRDVVLQLRVDVRERSTGAHASINRAAVVPNYLGDDFIVKKLADLLEEMALHEVRESIFVDDVLLRDPHAPQPIDFRFKPLPITGEPKE